MTDAAHESRNRIGGFALVILSAFCYSSLAIFGKLAFAERLPLVPFLSTRFTLATVILWGLALASPGSRSAIRRTPRRQLVELLFWGIGGYAVQSMLFFSALKTISASLTEVLLYTCPAFLAIILWIKTGRAPAMSRLTAIVVAIGGVILCVGPLGAERDLSGVLLGLGAGFWFAMFILGVDRASAGVPGLLGGALIISGATVAFDAAAIIGDGFVLPATARAWVAVLGVVLIPSVLGLVTFVVGLRRVGSQVTSILSTFEPLGTLLLASVFLDERLVASQWAGAILIIGAALILAARPVPRDRPSPAGRDVTPAPLRD